MSVTQRSMSVVIWAIGLAVALYICAVAGMFFAQRSLIFPAPEQAAEIPATYEKVHFETADGLRISGAYHRAVDLKPTVVFFHGNADGWAGGSLAMAAFANAGYGVLLPEYRGYAGNEGSPSEAGLYQDARAALGWLAAQGVAREQQILIGNSLGTGVAAQMASEKYPAALILISPFSSMADVVAEKVRWLPAQWLVRDRFETKAKIGQVEASILILHGRADDLIPFAQAEGLAGMAKQGELVAFEGVGHELAYLPEAGEAQLAWLERIAAQ